MTPRNEPPKTPVLISDKTDIPAPARPGQLRDSRNALMRQFDVAHRVLNQLS